MQFNQVLDKSKANPQATLIPIQALIAEENRDVVFVLKDGKAFRREVEKGLVKDTSVEILKGISPGEEVITAGQSTLRDGVPVRLTLRGEKG